MEKFWVVWNSVTNGGMYLERYPSLEDAMRVAEAMAKASSSGSAMFVMELVACCSQRAVVPIFWETIKDQEGQL